MSVANRMAPAKNSTLTTLPSLSDTVAARSTGDLVSTLAPSLGAVSVTDGGSFPPGVPAAMGRKVGTPLQRRTPRGHRARRERQPHRLGRRGIGGGVAHPPGGIRPRGDGARAAGDMALPGRRPLRDGTHRGEEVADVVTIPVGEPLVVLEPWANRPRTRQHARGCYALPCQLCQPDQSVRGAGWRRACDAP